MNICAMFTSRYQHVYAPQKASKLRHNFQEEARGGSRYHSPGTLIPSTLLVWYLGSVSCPSHGRCEEGGVEVAGRMTARLTQRALFENHWGLVTNYTLHLKQ